MKPINRLSFSQAAGYVRKMKDELESGRFKADILKRITDEAKISVSSPQSRQTWLLNAINGLDVATANGERVFLTITDGISNQYSRKQIAHILKEILRAKINGYTSVQIARFFKVQTNSIEALEELAKLELEASLKAKGFIELNDTHQ